MSTNKCACGKSTKFDDSVTPAEAAEEVVKTWSEPRSSDVLGSYTGMDVDGEPPQQDADDL